MLYECFYDPTKRKIHLFRLKCFFKILPTNSGEQQVVVCGLRHPFRLQQNVAQAPIYTTSVKMSCCITPPSPLSWPISRVLWFYGLLLLSKASIYRVPVIYSNISCVSPCVGAATKDGFHQ